VQLERQVRVRRGPILFSVSSVHFEENRRHVMHVSSHLWLKLLGPAWLVVLDGVIISSNTAHLTLGYRYKYL
jgi:hypothetical protein